MAVRTEAVGSVVRAVSGDRGVCTSAGSSVNAHSVRSTVRAESAGLAVLTFGEVGGVRT